MTSPEPSPARIAPRQAGVVRLCRAGDLPGLEWSGEFADHRRIIAETFARQQRGEGLMLVCEIDRFPVGQVWIRLTEPKPATARLWALRVMQTFRNNGIGERLIRRAEEMLALQGFVVSEIGADKGNDRARRLYERLGYTLSHDLAEPFSYVTPSGETRHGVADQWIFRKNLGAPP